ncbi:hypothetical protein [Pseudomonas sp. OA65]|uniref:hypothetical protein n=1 Tax=Pseudomonas sp. OA65 TaxID=2818431 RepID=UPI001A9DECA9|nr:hypothetical protein [Pseudomonas sp. OA65]MBO1537573.1 hypothetical protein [Pseudomonas sp. OA65]
MQTINTRSVPELVEAWSKVIRNNSAHSPFFKTSVRAATQTTFSDSNDFNVLAQKEIWIEEASTTQTVNPVAASGEEKAKLFRAGLEACLDADVFEPGLKSATEHYIEKWLQDDALLVQINLGKIYLDCSNNEKRLVGILNAIAHLSRETFHPVNELIARASLSHISVEVKECAIRVYEYWEDPTLITHLKNHALTPRWLDEYRQQVIADFCGDA